MPQKKKKKKKKKQENWVLGVPQMTVSLALGTGEVGVF